MWDILIILAAFICGTGFGKAQKCNQSEHFARIQDLISQSNREKEEMQQKWLDAEIKAETWKRRYQALIPTDEE